MLKLSFKQLGNKMTEFKLCEEMGLEVKNISLGFCESDKFIKASDVEKMLQNGATSRHTDTEKGAINELTAITVFPPQKLKPVRKDELLSLLENLRTDTHLIYKSKQDIIERIEKVGIE